MSFHPTRQRFGRVLLFLLAISFAGCGGATVAVKPQSTATVTALPAATATVPAANASCATLVPGAGPATGGASFPDLSFPATSVSAPPVPKVSGTGLFTVTTTAACSANTTANGVRAFFAAQLPSQGWAQSATLPFDGGYQDSCGDPYCWGKDAAPRYIGLEKVTDNPGGFVTYTIRLFTPPPTPNCPPGPPVSFVGFLPNHPGTPLPLPPLSSLGVSYGSSAYLSYHMCSTGDATSINLFLNTELPRLHFHQGTITVPHGLNCTNVSHTYTGWIDPSNTFGVDWTVADTAGSNLNPGRSWILGVCD